ncbi:hypothetical protein [Desmospora activa]|uniref:Uncharacterized protein n=1 Tax=Desmospora activa DSM 45169 TaxID=1121389 RepID=A0A2T4Z947_9BACL|nr:hypothetical protein [Desmospora activa]PTM58400.1 hypothetical protein C8J48_0983 [Desmospora activa DSM 45169]
MARIRKEGKKSTHTTLSPIERYYAGEISADDYVKLTEKSIGIDKTRATAEKRVRKILKKQRLMQA